MSKTNNLMMAVGHQRTACNSPFEFKSAPPLVFKFLSAGSVSKQNRNMIKNKMDTCNLLYVVAI